MKKLKRVLSMMLVVGLLVTASACNTDNPTSSSEEESKLTSSTKYQSQNQKPTPVPEKFKYFSTDIWAQVPMVSQELIDKGYKGGEGCQWMTYIAFDEIEGKTAYGCVDVGGILKSTDGGKSWVQSAIGMKSHGSTGVAVDPKNVKRVIAIGADSSQRPQNGLYLSTDEGVSWQGKCLMRVDGGRDFRRQVAFDETSYDKSAGYCKTIYWCTENVKDIIKGIYKSVNGGETWSLISGTEAYAGSVIYVHPTTGDVYISNERGLFKSTDGGKTFKNAGITEKCTYMAMVRTAPDKIYLTGSEHFYVYDTKTGSVVAQNKVGDGSGYPQYAKFISVSPANPKNMVLQEDRLGAVGEYNNTNYYSDDGGKTWRRATNSYAGAFMPYNARQNPSSFHPTDPNVVIKLGGDFIMRSEDGGKTYNVSNDGNSAIYIGGKYNFNVNNTDLLAVASQDYNGAFTTDGGKTWKYINWSGWGWGGYCYGAYILDKQTVVVGNCQDWYRGEVEICVTHDGGKTVTRTGIKTNSTPIGCGALGNDKIAFFADYRTTDGGYTWTKMDGCKAVYCVDYKEGRLFGLDNRDFVVMSEDNGVTWKTINSMGPGAKDMSFDHENNLLYVSGNSFYAINVVNNKMVYIDSNKSGFTGLSIDPGNTKIMYGLKRDWSNAGGDSVWRSIDGGKTWHTMNINVGDGREGTPDGGRVSDNVRVNMKGEAFFSTNCRGMWKLQRPNLNEER